MEYGTGCLPGKKDIRDYRIKRKVCLAQEFPDEFLCEKTTSIKNQGGVGSCVAHATAEILEAHFGGRITLSTNFIYGIHKKLYGSNGPGMYLREACKIAKQYGDPEYSYCKGNTEVDKVYGIAEEAFNNTLAMQNALKYSIDNYAKLFSDNDIKFALMNYGPVLAAVTWYNDNKCENGILKRGNKKSGGHAIMVKGWTPVGWYCQNSWGLGWGMGGNFILPYDYKLNEAFSFIPRDNNKDIVVPKRNKVIDFFARIINWFINLF